VTLCLVMLCCLVRPPVLACTFCAVCQIRALGSDKNNLALCRCLCPLMLWYFTMTSFNLMMITRSSRLPEADAFVSQSGMMLCSSCIWIYLGHSDRIVRNYSAMAAYKDYRIHFLIIQHWLSSYTTSRSDQLRAREYGRRKFGSQEGIATTGKDGSDYKFMVRVALHCYHQYAEGLTFCSTQSIRP
jgi:hypothetical protein